MITRIFNNGSSHNGLILLPLKEIKSLSIDFSTEEERDCFCKQFPKSMKVYCGFISDYENGKMTKIPHASIRMMSLNKVTGDKNETGLKRVERFYKAVQLKLKEQIKSL